MKVSNILKIYEDRKVLDIKNITFDDGKIYALIGPNGSGKSTLGKVLAGIIKNDSKKYKANKINISYMPQKSFAFDLTVNKNLTINNNKKDEAIEYSKRLNLEKLLKHNAKKLSGGELSKVSLIRTLLNDSNFIILDEPTASMDIESMLESERIIKEINKNNKTTILLITHSISQAKRIADKIIFINNGKIIDDKLTPKTIDKSSNEIIKNFIKLYSK